MDAGSGGKDSLVALDIVQSRGARPHLLYVADGLREYENSPRLQAIVRMNADIPVHVGMYTLTLRVINLLTDCLVASSTCV